jgi:hypothetical protein
MLLYGAIYCPRQPHACHVAEYWHPDDQYLLYNGRMRCGEQIRSLAHWLGADADSISDASLNEVPATIATSHFMWGGINMENAQ